jgi:signal transduction histidine kinase
VGMAGAGRGLLVGSGRTAAARRRLQLGVGLGAAVVFSAAFAWLLWSGILGRSPTVALDDLAEATSALVAAGFAARAAFRSRGRMRGGWALLGAAMLAWGTGQAIWSVKEVFLRIPIPVPSISDIGYLAAIPLEVAAVLTFPVIAGQLSALLRTLLDGLLIATSLFLISLVLVLQQVIQVGDGSSLGLALNLAYPVGDVATCGVVFLALSRAGRGLRIPMAILGAAFAVIALSDSYFAYATAAGFYASGAWPDTGWVLGYLLVALAAATSDQVTAEPAADVPESRIQAAVPYLVLVLTIGVAAFNIARGGPNNVGIRWTTIVIACIVAAGLFVHRADLLRLLRRSMAAEAVLARNEAILTRLLESAPAALFSVATDGRILLHRGRVFLGLVGAGGNLEGLQVRDLLKNFPPALAIVEKALVGVGGTVTVESWPNQVELVCSPVFATDGSLESVSGIAIDVTSQRSLYRAMAENDAKSRLLATVSHELRTPLNVVLGFTDLMSLPQTGPLNEKQARYLGHVSSGGRHILHLVNGILDFSKLAAGGTLDVQLSVVDAGAAVFDAIEKVRPLAGQRRLLDATQPGSDYAVIADPVRLDQILLNLLSNALKSTEVSGKVTLNARRRGDRVAITVTDDGVGIATADLERIFDEYIQVEGGRAASDGTGLGLPVSRRLAELMNGTLTVASELGRGSSFRLSLPAATPVEGANARTVGVD